MIKLLYTTGVQSGELCRSWENVQEFCQETIHQVAMVANENKLDQRSVFTHYGFEVVTTATGANGFKNGVLASMNFWLDSLPNTAFVYDSGDTEDERQKAFYELLNKIAMVPGMQTFRTSSNLWNLYNDLSKTVSPVPLKLWEPTTDHPQQVLQDYPRVGAMLEAAGLLGSDRERNNRIGEWAFLEMLNGAEEEKTLRIMRDVQNYQRAEMPALKEPVQDLFAAIYAFLQGKFYEELNLTEEETR